MAEQSFMVTEQDRRGGASLELAGEWLEEAGFRAGSRVGVEVVESGRLVVTRVDAGGPVPALLPLVWVPVERLTRLDAGSADG